MKKLLSILLAAALLISLVSVFSVTGLLATAAEAGQVPTGDTVVKVINDSSTDPIMTNKTGGLNLIGVKDPVVENGMTKVEVAGYSGGDPVSQMWITPPADASDFSDVTAIQMYIKNESPEPFAWTWLRVGDDTNCESSKMYIQKDGAWVAAETIKPDADSYDVKGADGKVWRKLWASNALVVPGSYEGLIRIELNTDHYKNNAPQLLDPLSAIAIAIVVPSDTKPTFWLDDLATVSEPTATEVTGSWSSKEYPFFNLTYGEDGVITVGDTVSDNLDKMYYEFAEEIDLYNVTSMNFYIKNDTGLPLAFYEVAVSASMGGAENEKYLDNPEYVDKYVNALWALKHDINNYPIQVKALVADAWTNADTTAYGGTGASMLTIPAGFEGYVSVPLSPEEQMKDGGHRYAKGMALMLGVGYKDGTSTPQKDDYAGKSFTIKNITMVRPAEGLSGSWKSVEYPFHNLTYGKDGTITFGNASDAYDKMVYTFDEPLDLYYVEDIHFSFKNNTGLPITFCNASAKASTDPTDSESADFLAQYPHALWTLGHDFGANPFYVKAAGTEEWVPADTTNYGKDNNAVLTIPADFEGEVKLPLGINERTFADGTHRISTAFALIMCTGTADGEVKWTDYAGKTMVITGVDATINKAANLYPAPAAPEGLGSTACTTRDNNDGTITGVNDTMEYCLAGGEWTAVEAGATTVTGLAAGTYQVRLKAAAPYPAGATATVKIAEWVSPDAKDYITVVEDFEDVNATADIIKGAEYTFLGGTDWFPCENTANNSAAVKQMLFADPNNPFQKTLVTTELGDMRGVEYVQMYLEWTGESAIQLQGQVGASMSTPAWYRFMEDLDPDWETNGAFWKTYIMVNGNTNAMTSVGGNVVDVLIQNEDGAWVQAEANDMGGFIPAGYTGYVRFAVPEICKIENLPFGFGWVLYDPTRADLDGTMIVDDIALVNSSETPVEGALPFEEYVQVKGEGFDPDAVPTTTTTQRPTTTKPTDLEFGFDDEESEDEDTTTTAAVDGEASEETPESPDTGVGVAAPIALLAVAAGAVLVLSRKNREN